MSELADTLRRTTEALDGLGVRYALVGGIAVSVRAEPRFTRDVDVAVSVPDDSSAESLVRELLSAGWTLLAQVEQDATGRLSTVRTRAPGTGEGGVVVDFLFASSGFEPEVVAAAELVEALPDLIVPVARTPHLVAMKVLAMNRGARLQDRVDALSLLGTMDAGGVEEARRLLRLVRERGFDRGKDLQAEFEALLRDKPSD